MALSREVEAKYRVGSVSDHVGRVRRTGRLGELAMRLDEVEHLGGFLEVGRAVPAGWSAVAVRDSLDSFACSLGVPLRPAPGTYDCLVHAALVAAI